MLLFVGRAERGYWAEEPAKINGEAIEYIDENNDIRKQTNDILRRRNEKVNYVIYDIEQYGITTAIIANEIKNIYLAGNAEPVFLATEFLPTSDLVIKLQEKGFNKFIFSFTDTDKKNELEKCMNGYYDIQRSDKLMDIEEKNSTQKERITVGVGGACHRMGTTTQAMQLVKHLLFCGKKACYVDLNGGNFIVDLLNTFDVEEHDDVLGKVKYSNVDLYYKQEMIPEILQMDYDYYIYDYGVFDSQDFNKISYFEKSIRIMVLGSNPGELHKSTEVIDNVFYQDVIYVFNFTSPADQEELLENMGEKRNCTYFMDFCPDMFVYAPSNHYNKILKITGQYPINKKNKKKNILPWKKRKEKNEQV